MSSPWLSVVMPICNGGRYLREALESVVRQGDNGIEVIVVDDGSRDESLEIARSYRNRLALTVHALPHRGNWVANVNYGIRLATGEYISILHQDDAWSPRRLSQMKRLIDRHRRAAIFVHPCWYANSEGRRIGYWCCPFPRSCTTIGPQRVLERLLVQCLYGMPAPLFRASLARDVGLLDESLWFAADWDLWLKLTGRGDTIYCATPLAIFRLHGASQTIVRGGNSNEIFHQQTLVLRRHLGQLRDRALAADVLRVAMFSIEVNAALNRILDGRTVDTAKLASSLFRLGWPGCRRYFRDARLAERCLSRVQAGALDWRPIVATAPARGLLRSALGRAWHILQVQCRGGASIDRSPGPSLSAGPNRLIRP